MHVIDEHIGDNVGITCNQTDCVEKVRDTLAIATDGKGEADLCTAGKIASTTCDPSDKVGRNRSVSDAGVTCGAGNRYTRRVLVEGTGKPCKTSTRHGLPRASRCAVVLLKRETYHSQKALRTIGEHTRTDLLRRKEIQSVFSSRKSIWGITQ